MTAQQKARDLRLKTPEDLKSILLDARKEHFNLRFQQTTGQQEGIKNIRTLRRLVARIKTITMENKRSISRS